MKSPGSTWELHLILASLSLVEGGRIPGVAVKCVEIGAYIAAHPVDEVLLLGDLAAEIGRGLLGAGSEVPVTLCKDLEEVKGWLNKQLKEGDWVFFKGSNSMGLSEAVSYVKNQRSQQTI